MSFVKKRETERGKFEVLEAELKSQTWKDFKLEDSTDHRYFQSGASYDTDTVDEKRQAKQNLVQHVLNQYRDRGPQFLAMPFSEFTFREQAETIGTVTVVLVTAPIWINIYVFRHADISFSVMVDA